MEVSTSRYFGAIDVTAEHWDISTQEYFGTADLLAQGRYFTGTLALWTFWHGYVTSLGYYALPRNHFSDLIWALVHCIASLTLVRFGSILASRLPMYTLY